MTRPLRALRGEDDPRAPFLFRNSRLVRLEIDENRRQHGHAEVDPESDRPERQSAESLEDLKHYGQAGNESLIKGCEIHRFPHLFALMMSYSVIVAVMTTAMASFVLVGTWPEAQVGATRAFAISTAFCYSALRCTIAGSAVEAMLYAVQAF